MMLAIITLCMTVLLGLFFLGLFVWAVQDGQMADLEEAKYEMFREPLGTPRDVPAGRKEDEGEPV